MLLFNKSFLSIKETKTEFSLKTNQLANNINANMTKYTNTLYHIPHFNPVAMFGYRQTNKQTNKQTDSLEHMVHFDLATPCLCDPAWVSTFLKR